MSVPPSLDGPWSVTGRSNAGPDLTGVARVNRSGIHRAAHLMADRLSSPSRTFGLCVDAELTEFHRIELSMSPIQLQGQVLEDPFSSGRRYTVVYADPPWRYRDQARAGERGALYKYPLLTDKDIADLPVAQITAEHAALFLWATWPKLPEILPIIDAWGFNYRTAAFVWVKRTRIKRALAWGMGSWTRANTEPCLLATRGKPKRLSAGVHQVVESPAGVHSKKPIEVQERIVQLMGDVPRIELFAREAAHGWDTWGNDLSVENADGESRKAGSPDATETSDTSSAKSRSPNREPDYDLFGGEIDRKETNSELDRYSPAHGDRRRLVLEYVKAHGRVTRGELAEICGTTPEEASAVLRTLVDEGYLRMRGQKRWAWYETSLDS